jgi:hypothetical protein
MDRRLVRVVAVELGAGHVHAAERLMERLAPVLEGDVVRGVHAWGDCPMRRVLDDWRPDQVVLFGRCLLGLELVDSLL